MMNKDDLFDNFRYSKSYTQISIIRPTNLEEQVNLHMK